MLYKNLKILFCTPSQAIVIFGLAVFFFFLTASLGNLSSLVEFFSNDYSYGPLLYIQLLLSLLLTSFASPLSLTLAIFLSFLVAINLILLTQARYWPHLKNQPFGLLGIASGILGIGCTACGALLSTSLVSLFGVTFVVATLPFQSLFFQLTGILLLIVSITLLLKEFDNNTMCKIK